MSIDIAWWVEACVKRICDGKPKGHKQKTEEKSLLKIYGFSEFSRNENVSAIVSEKKKNH